MTAYDPSTPEGRAQLRDTLALGSQPWTVSTDGEFDAQGEYVLCRAGFKNLDGTVSPDVFVAAFDEPDDLYVAQAAATTLPAALDCIEELEARIVAVREKCAAYEDTHDATNPDDYDEGWDRGQQVLISGIRAALDGEVPK